jgi:capsular polysaccharide biosynthesis protein
MFIQTQIKNMQSDEFLGQVVESLQLKESPARLRNRISFSTGQKSAMMAIFVYDKSATQAAVVANAIVSNAILANRAAIRNAFKSLQPDDVQGHVELDGAMGLVVYAKASPESSYARRNKPHIMILGTIGGILLALVIGGAGALLVRLRRRSLHSQAATP